MSRSEVFKCDVCKKQKGEANHWFLAAGGVGIQIMPWDKGLAKEPKVFHLCGEECVQRKVSEFLSARAA